MVKCGIMVLFLASLAAGFSPAAMRRLPIVNHANSITQQPQPTLKDATFQVPDSYLEGRGLGLAVVFSGAAGLVAKGALAGWRPRALLQAATRARPDLVAAAAVAAASVFFVLISAFRSHRPETEADRASPDRVKKLDGHLTSVLGEKPLFGLIARRAEGERRGTGKRRDGNPGWDLQANLDVHAITQGP